MKLSKLLLIPLLGIMIFTGISNINNVKADSNSQYIYWQRDASNLGVYSVDYWSEEQYMWLEQKPANTFWTIGVGFANGDSGGYFGILTPTIGDTALFSLWNSNAARGTSCSKFIEDGAGYHCSISIKINPYTLNKLTVKKLSVDSEGRIWWGAYFNNKFVGALRVNSSNKYLTVPQNFIEYPPGGSCSTIPKAAVNWVPPTFNNGTYRTIYKDSTLPCSGDSVVPNAYRMYGP
jgi:hypothetical protein